MHDGDGDNSNDSGDDHDDDEDDDDDSLVPYLCPIRSLVPRRNTAPRAPSEAGQGIQEMRALKHRKVRALKHRKDP